MQAPAHSTSQSHHGDARTITLVVTMPIKPEWEGEFVASARRFCTLVEEREPDVLVYALTKHPTRESTYVWIERYRDEAAFAAHGQTPHMAEIRPKLGTFIAGPVEVLRLAQVAPA